MEYWFFLARGVFMNKIFVLSLLLLASFVKTASSEELTVLTVAAEIHSPYPFERVRLYGIVTRRHVGPGVRQVFVLVDLI